MQFDYKDNQNILESDPDLFLLVKFIMNNEQYKPFRQVQKIFYFEPHVNIDIFIVRYVKNDMINAFYTIDMILEYTDKLRYHLFSFQSSLLALDNEINLKDTGSTFTPFTGYLGTFPLSSTTGSTSGYDNNQIAIVKRSHEVDGLKTKFEYIFFYILEGYEHIFHKHKDMKS